MNDWLHRARHAWRVGLDGPWPVRVLVRVLYTFGFISSPTYMRRIDR